MYNIAAYNANNPEKWIQAISDGVTVSIATMAAIQAKCDPGPYFGFSIKQPGHVFRFRGPYHGMKPFFILDSTGIKADDDMMKTHRQIVSAIEKQEKQGAAK